MKKRIGVLTFHHIPNEGAILQAYCLSKRLAKAFPEYDVDIIDYRSASAEKHYFKLTFLSSKKLRTIIHKVKRYFRLQSFVNKNLPLSHKKIVTDNIEQCIRIFGMDYDAIVVGSDEVWKVEKKIQLRPFPNIYWLSPNLRCKKFSYAASANKLEYHDFPFEKLNWIRDQLDTFDLIGVRDDHTQDLIKYINVANQSKVLKVPDPTFTWEIPEIDLKTFLNQCGVDFNKKLFGITFTNNSFVPELIKHYKGQGYQVIALTANNPHADVNLAGKLDPFEWANTFHYFDVCCTNLFHGTIFSIKAGIPFVSFDYFNGPNYDTKAHCLLKEFSLLPHYLPMQGTPPSLKEIIDQIDRAKILFNKEYVARMIAERKKVADQFFEKMEKILCHD